MASLFNTILYQPLFNSLVFLYQYVAFEDLGLAIILLTIIIRFILFPLFYKSFKSQTLMQKLHPEIQKIQHSHKDNREKQAQALMELYRVNKVNPFSSFLMILVQLPILIALYRLFLEGFSPESFNNLYSFIAKPEHLNSSFLGLVDLSSKNMIIVLLAAVVQYFQGKLSLPKVDKNQGQEMMPASKIGRQMVIIGPILTFVILRGLPSAIGVYWLTTSIFSIFQQIYINKQVYGNDNRNNKKIS